MMLPELQRAFKNFILSRDDNVARHVAESEHAPAGLRLAVYSDAYQSRMAEALASNYPQLQQQLGEQPFTALARAYLTEHPSRNVSVRWFGDQLPNYLTQQARYTNRPWLAELAQWEWAIAFAFDAPEAAPLSAEALGRFAPADWATLRFGVHPSTQRLLLHTNAPALFKALADETEWPSPQILSAAQDWLIWRQALTPKYRSLAPDEARAFDLLCSHGTFGEMCEVLCEWHEPQRVPTQAATLLQRWVSDQLLIGFP